MKTVIFVSVLLALLVPYISACKLLHKDKVEVAYNFGLCVHGVCVYCHSVPRWMSMVKLLSLPVHLGGSNKDRVRLEDVGAVTLTQVS